MCVVYACVWYMQVCLCVWHMHVCGVCMCVCLYAHPTTTDSLLCGKSQPSTQDAAEDTAACGDRGDLRHPSPLPPGSARGRRCARNTPGRRDKQADGSIADNACLLPKYPSKTTFKERGKLALCSINTSPFRVPTRRGEDRGPGSWGRQVCTVANTNSVRQVTHRLLRAAKGAMMQTEGLPLALPAVFLHCLFYKVCLTVKRKEHFNV